MTRQPGIHSRWLAAVAVAAALSASCSSSNSNTHNVGDTGTGSDAVADIGSDLAGSDTLLPTDVPVSTDAQTPSDVPTDASGACASNGDCVGAAGGPVCDTTMGLCVACTPTMNMCMTGNYCTSSDTCAPGCASDSDCAASGAVHCDITTNMCVGCRVGTPADCAPGTVCTGGICVPGCSSTTPCGIGTTCCGTACANTMTDSANCGACGMACATGTTCCAGVCATVSGDVNNCGGCGVSCALANVATPTCTAGACSIAAGACTAGFADCDHVVTNGCEAATATDTMNCGACGAACAAGINSTATCTAGTCGLSCTGGFGDCNHLTSDGCEATLGTDPLNCGACGTACPMRPNATASCAMGACGSACSPGFGDCDGNPTNGCETNLNTTATACGSCTTVCSAANATPSCAAGACGVGICNPGFADCDHLLSNGCETSVATGSNCGACGTVCGLGTACTLMGSTYACTSVCATGTTACSGACVATMTDPTNCGGCAHTCTTPPNGIPGCTAGVCGLASCDPGFGDCNHTAADGCEVDLRSTLTNCGACGTSCAAPTNATPACTAGTCGIGTCSANFGNCDGVASNGCETDLRVTAADCGACGTACAAPANATAACAASVCGLGTCNAGFADCNHTPGDGCEINTNTDNHNCGTCGHACAAGMACSAGTCQTVCGTGLTFCAGTGTCANLTSDPANCGACAHACGTGNICRSSVCVPTPPANDTCAGAIPISLATHAVDITSTTVNAFHDLTTPTGCPAFGGPTESGADVFYSFTLTQPELVYADTVGSTVDTILFFANSCTTPLPLSVGTTGLVECDDDLNDVGCATSTQSQVVAYLQPGSYYLVLSGWGTATGASTIHFRHEPVGNNGAAAGVAPPAPVLLPAGMSSQSGTTANTGLITAASVGLTACYTNGGAAASSEGNGPENTYFWRTCPETAAGAFLATTCGVATHFDTLIYVATPAVGSVGGDCDDDNSACAFGSVMPPGYTSVLPHPTGGTVTIPAGANLHVFVVDGYNTAATSAGAYTVQVERP